jgi:hypothetical protein
MAVARSVAAALAPATSGQYAGAAHIFIMFCMYIEGNNFALPASDTVLCLYLQWQSLTVDPKNLKTKLSASFARYLHERLVARATGLRVGSAIRAIHGPPMHHGTKAFVSDSGETQAPYHTGTAHSHETVPRHRLVHPHYGGRVGSHAHRFLLFPAEGQLHSGQSRCI